MPVRHGWAATTLNSMSRIFDKGRDYATGRWMIAGWLLLSVGVIAIGVHAWMQAGSLSSTLGEQAAERQLRGALETRLAAEGASGLQPYVETLVNRGAMGLRQLAIRVPGGTVVAQAGAYDNFTVPMISPLYVDRLRRFMLESAGSTREFTLTRDGRTVATVSYVVAAGSVRDVRTDAVTALANQAWLLIGIGLLLLLVGLLPVLRPSPMLRQQLSERAGNVGPRLDSNGPAAPTTADGSLDGHAARALDRLQRGVIVIDADLRLREINPVAQTLTGWSREAAMGRLVYSVFHPLADDDQPLTTPAETAVRENCETTAEECRLRSRDGSIRHIEMAAAVLEGRNGRPDGAVLFFHNISARRENVDRLRADAQRTQDVVDHLDDGILTTDAAGVITFANARAARMFGYRRAELVGATITKLMPVPFLNMPDVHVHDYGDDKARARLPRVVGWRRDATTFPIDLHAQPLQVEGDMQGDELVLVIRDLTQQLRKDNLSLRMGRLFDHAAEEIYVFDAQSMYFTEVNRAAQRNIGLEEGQLARMTPAMITQDIDVETLQEYYARLRSGAVEHLHYRARHQRADGSSYPVEVRLSYSRAEEPPVFMAMATDCSERETNEARLARQAMQDDLTGLPNRAMAISTLRDAIRKAVQNGDNLAAVFVDLDRFKRINDTYGHEAGDQVLRETGERLASFKREGCFIARLSGDEFVVLCAGLADRAATEALAERLRASFDLAHTIGDRSVSVSASIGVAVFCAGSEDPVEPGALLSQADRAMYLAKKAGGGRAHVYFGSESTSQDSGKRHA